MEPATRFIYGADFTAALVATAYVVTVHHAWAEVGIGAACWACCGVALMAVLDGGAWWIVLSDAKRHAPEDTSVIAGRIGEAIRHPAQRAA